MTYRIRRDAPEIHADEAHLMSGMERLLGTLEQNRASVLIGLLVAVLAIAAVAGALWYESRQDAAAEDLYREATRLYLDRPVDSLAKANEHLQQAIEKFRQVINQYPRSHGAPLALFQLGNALVQHKELKDGIEAYNKYVTTYGTNKMMLGLVYQRMAYAHLLNNDQDAAVKAFTMVVTLPGTLNKDQVLFELGKLEEAVSRPEGALAHYQDLVKIFPNSPFAGEATVRMKALEAKKAPGSSAPTVTPPPVPSGKPATR